MVSVLQSLQIFLVLASTESEQRPLDLAFPTARIDPFDLWYVSSSVSFRDYT